MWIQAIRHLLFCNDERNTAPPVYLASDLVVSVTQPCYHVDYFIGILGMDLHLPDLVEDITYFSQTGGRYAFIIDDHGTTVGCQGVIDGHGTTAVRAWYGSSTTAV